MKQVLVRLEVVELDDHDTKLIPDETTIFRGEKAIQKEQYNYENVNELEEQADQALQRYFCALNDHEDNRDYESDHEMGTVHFCPLCEVDIEIDTEPVEPDYDDVAKDYIRGY